MLFPRRKDLSKRIKAAGLKLRDIAACLGITENRVSQRLSGFLPLSTNDELKILRILENQERNLKK